MMSSAERGERDYESDCDSPTIQIVLYCRPNEVLYVHLLLAHPAGILLQDDEPFQYVCVRDVLLCRQFRALRRAQSHWRRVCLEAGNRTWLACLTNNVDGLSATS